MGVYRNSSDNNGKAKTISGKGKTCWFAKMQTLSHHDVSTETRENYILSGYRRPNQSIYYYVTSAFYPSNEFMNIWTHFLPFLHFVYKYSSLYLNHQGPLETFTYPFYVHGLTCIFVLLSSSIAHLFSSRSTVVCDYCFAVDVISIYVFSYALRTSLEHYLCPMDCYQIWPFTEMSLRFFFWYWMLSVFGYIFFHKLNKSIGRVFTVLSHLGGASLGFSPCFVRYFGSDVPQYSHISSLIEGAAWPFFFSVSAMLTGCIVYSFRIPERFLPGHFDIFGSSHQLMHISTAASMYIQSWLFESNMNFISKMLSTGEISKSMVDQMTFQNTVASTIFLFLSAIIVIFLKWKLQPKIPSMKTTKLQ